jgi:hypothetical protein
MRQRIRRQNDLKILTPIPIAVNLSFGMNDMLYKKVSPPFEGGVVGMIDYHIYTIFSFPTGVVDSLISSYLH